MNATNTAIILRNSQFSSASLKTGVPRSAKEIGKLHGEDLRAAIKTLREPELLAFMVNEDVRHATKVAAIASLDSRPLLIAIARSNASNSLRRNALQRIDELCDRTPLEKSDVEHLVPCLNEEDLIVFTVVLMDMSDYDWPLHCNEGTIRSLCSAMYACSSIHETVLLEDTYAHLVHSRPDLGKSLNACSPASFLKVA